MIDWVRTQQLRDEVGADAFEEIAEMFLAKAAAAVAALSADAPAQKMAADLHAIKGSALNLGFRTLAALCADGEAAALAGRPQDADLPAIRRAFQLARTEFMAQKGLGG